MKDEDSEGNVVCGWKCSDEFRSMSMRHLAWLHWTEHWLGYQPKLRELL